MGLKSEKSSLEIVASLIHENLVGADITKRIVVPYDQIISKQSRPQGVFPQSEHMRQECVEQGLQVKKPVGTTTSISGVEQRMPIGVEIPINTKQKQHHPDVIDLTESPQSLHWYSEEKLVLNVPNMQQCELVGSIEPSLGPFSKVLQTSDTGTETKKVLSHRRPAFEGHRPIVVDTLSSYAPGRSLFSCTEQNSSYSSGAQEPKHRPWKDYLDHNQPLGDNKSNDLSAERRNLPPLRLFPNKSIQRPAHRIHQNEGRDQNQEVQNNFYKFAYGGDRINLCDVSGSKRRSKVRGTSGRGVKQMFGLNFSDCYNA